MARDLESLETAVGLFESDMNDEAGKVFDRLDAVRAKAPDIFKRVHARIDAKAKTVERVDALLTNLDRSNGPPTSPGSLNGSGTSSETATEPVAADLAPAQAPADSAEKKS